MLAFAGRARNLEVGGSLVIVSFVASFKFCLLGFMNGKIEVEQGRWMNMKQICNMMINRHRMVNIQI